MKKRDRAQIAAVEDALKRAMAAIQNRQPAVAERIARDVLARDCRHPGALHVVGLALLAQGRAREAIAPLEQATHGRAGAVSEAHLAIAVLQNGRPAQARTVVERES